MKQASSSLLHMALVCLLLLVQLAGSSPELHQALHGGASCGEHTGPCGSEDGDKEDNPCDEPCAIVLLSGGVTLTEGYAPEQLAVPTVRVVADGYLGSGATGTFRTTRARAPPVL